jgi:hypothetical protein
MGFHLGGTDAVSQITDRFVPNRAEMGNDAVETGRHELGERRVTS